MFKLPGELEFEGLEWPESAAMLPFEVWRHEHSHRAPVRPDVTHYFPNPADITTEFIRTTL